MTLYFCKEYGFAYCLLKLEMFFSIHHNGCSYGLELIVKRVVSFIVLCLTPPNRKRKTVKKNSDTSFRCWHLTWKGWATLYHHTKNKGDLGVLKAQVDLHQKGYLILLPHTEYSPFDLDGVYNGGSYNVLYSKNRDIVILPLVMISQFLEGNSPPILISWNTWKKWLSKILE